MRKQFLLAGLVVFFFTQTQAFPQLAGANDSGVAIGHIHLYSKDPDAQKKIWTDAFGAQVTKTGTLELLRLPGVFIIMAPCGDTPVGWIRAPFAWFGAPFILIAAPFVWAAFDPRFLC